MKVSMNTAARAARTLADPRWAAVLQRDASADGSFYFSVSTTGVYCRPSCGARPARPEHVDFHATCEEAERAGFRPCKRCKPDALGLRAQQAALVTQACRTIEAAIAAESTVPTLAALAAAAGLSPYHFHRVFKTITGVTPRAYAAAQRAARTREALGRGEAVTQALLEGGFGSNARFYAQADGMLGMTPSQFKAGGRGAQIRFAVGQGSLGAVLVAQSARGICAVLIGDEAEALVQDLQRRFPRAELVAGDTAFESLVARVLGFVDARGTGFDLPLDLQGTGFQQRVWQALREIRPGETLSYTELARRLGIPNAVRAVASACAANPVAVLVPCHRILRTDGSISGYRWGVDRKRALLLREQAAKARGES